jgi:hypothetical protein
MGLQRSPNVSRRHMGTRVGVGMSHHHNPNQERSFSYKYFSIAFVIFPGIAGAQL